MPEYLAPAVFVEETSFRSKSIEGVGTSTAAFVGMTGRGPVAIGNDRITPPLLTSFADFERYYGGFEDLTISGSRALNYVAHGARAFFDNGGSRLYVARILGAGARKPDPFILKSAADAPDPAANDRVTVNARFAGGASFQDKPGANLRVVLQIVSQASTKALALKQPAGTLVQFDNKLKIIGEAIGPAVDETAFDGLANDAPVEILTMTAMVEDAAGNVLEYPSLGFHPRHPRFAGAMLGKDPPRASDALTNPILLELGSDVTAFEFHAAVDAFHGKPNIELRGGADGPGGPPSSANYHDALAQLSALEDISIVAAPGGSAFGKDQAAAVNNELIIAAEARRSYRIAVLDTENGLELAGVREAKSKVDSKYAALYFPWVVVPNPLSGVDPLAKGDIALPPSGFVCGIYARSDIQRGVWKAPANETVLGALRLAREVSFGEQEVLNPLGINCLRTLPNRGIRVWGARTTSSDPEWKYVNIRRYFLYLESSIDRGTQWAVFEPNGERLWANVRETVSDFLYNEWVNGALLGTTPKEAFFVRCDRTTMTQNDLDNGRLICLIGVAAIKPAEFVIFRIGQKTADARS